MRYCTNFYLNWQKNCERSKLNIHFLLSRFDCSNIDQPVEVEVPIVPHFKAPFTAKVGPGRLECGGPFT